MDVLLATQLHVKDVLERASNMATTEGLYELAKLFNGEHWSTTTGKKGGKSYTVSNNIRYREWCAFIRGVCPDVMFYNELTTAMNIANIGNALGRQYSGERDRMTIRQSDDRCGWCGSREGYDDAKTTGDWPRCKTCGGC